ncbi:MAG: cytochrome b [Paracoccaceae bacterium]|uniref:cytochrome b n=1 Tax=Seohaeicola saemankumensis TaxID=481181 RepID=UPI002E7C34BC|nr:cytochrome b [Seohaeicola saemankumensis]
MAGNGWCCAGYSEAQIAQNLTVGLGRLLAVVGDTEEGMKLQQDHYKAPARWLHWTVAALVLAMIPVGALMVQEGLGRSLQNSLFIFHKNTGVIVGLLVTARLLYRWRNPPPKLPQGLPLWQRRVAFWTHAFLYTLIVIMPISGYVRVRSGGFPIELLDAMGIGTLLPKSDAVANAAKSLHYAGAWALVILVAMHIGAALQHALIKRDGVFERMWPRKD